MGFAEIVVGFGEELLAREGGHDRSHTLDFVIGFFAGDPARLDPFRIDSAAQG